MGDRQWPDPQGWEALTQAEAERDARALAAKVRGGLPPRITLHPKQPRNTLAGHQHDANARHEALDAILDALAVAERERDQAREALRRIAEPVIVPRSDEAKAACFDGLVGIARAALAEGPQT